MKYLRHVSAMLIFLAVTILYGCATPYPVYEVERDELRQWFSSAKALVEEDRQMDLGNVTLSTVSGREMLFVLSDLYGKKLDPNMTADTRVRLFAAKAFEDVKYIQAVYDPFAKRIVINGQNLQYYIGMLTERGINPRDAAMTILIHELIHAADDKEFDLVAIEEKHRGDTLGVFMVAEGHAEMQTERLCVKAGCSSAFRTAQIEFHGADPQDTDQTLLTSTNNNGLIYVQGRRFLKALANRDSSGQLVRQALTNPPGDVLEFFDPASFPDNARSDRRKNIYRVLESMDINSESGPLLKIPQAVFNESDLPSNTQARLDYVREYKRKTLASGGMSYVQQNDEDLSTVWVKLYEAANPVAAFELQQTLLTERQTLSKKLKNMGADVTHPGKKALSAMSQSIPENARRYVVNLRDRQSGNTLQMITSYLVEGRYLIVVGNVDEPAANSQALQTTLQRLKAI